MNSKDGLGYSAPFDEMLAESHKRFDDLSRRPGADEGRKRPDEPAPAPPPPQVSERASPAPPAASSPEPARAGVDDAGSSEPARALDARFGDRWRYEIAERRREGEEVVVWGRLIVEEAGVDKTRRARARIRRPARAGVIEGSAGGTDFSLRQGEGLPSETNGHPEESAFREAAQAALAICLKGVV